MGEYLDCLTRVVLWVGLLWGGPPVMAQVRPESFNLRWTDQLVHKGKRQDSYRINEFNCLGSDCTFVTIKVGECKEGKFAILQEAWSTEDGDLVERRDGRGVSVTLKTVHGQISYRLTYNSKGAFRNELTGVNGAMTETSLSEVDVYEILPIVVSRDAAPFGYLEREIVCKLSLPVIASPKARSVK